jgi:hypothetical protein
MYLDCFLNLKCCFVLVGTVRATVFLPRGNFYQETYVTVDVSHVVGECARAREVVDFEYVEANWRQLIVEEGKGEKMSLFIERNLHEGCSLATFRL